MPQNARILDFTAFLQEKPATPGEKPRKKAARHKSGLFRRHFRYKDPITGETRQKDVYGTTAAEAEKKKKDFLRKVEQGLRVAENGHTVAQWADQWLETYKRPYVKETTFTTYAKDVQRIKEMLGLRPLSAILSSDIQRLMQTRNGLSASAIKKTYMTINAMMTAAVDNRLITFNPCRGIKIPDGTTGTHRELTKDEIALIVSVAADGHRFGLVMMLMLYAGLRRGEAVAIRPEDIYDDKIHVTRAAYFVTNAAKLGSPKSAAGIRAIPILSPLKPYLSAFSGYAAKPSDGRDQLVSLQTFNRGYQSFIHTCEVKLNGCKKTDLRKGQQWQTVAIRAHDLRHTFCGMLHDAGVDIKTAQHWLGHSDPAITLKFYTHFSESRSESAYTSVERFIAGSPRSGKTDGIKTWRIKKSKARQ